MLDLNNYQYKRLQMWGLMKKIWGILHVHRFEIQNCSAIGAFTYDNLRHHVFHFHSILSRYYQIRNAIQPSIETSIRDFK